MAEEHIFDRITKAEAAERSAIQKVNKLIEAFQEASRKLGVWRTVSFKWRDEDGTLHAPAPGSHSDMVISIADIPSLESIRDAIIAWSEADRLVKSLHESLTEDQRQTLRLPPYQ